MSFYLGLSILIILNLAAATRTEKHQSGFDVRCEDFNCMSCDPKNPNICYICARPYFLEQATCVPSCTYGYQDHAAGICTMCEIDHCNSCINDPKICNRCDENFEVNPQGICVKATKTFKGMDSNKGPLHHRDPRFLPPPPKRHYHYSTLRKNKVHPLLIIIPIVAAVTLIFLVSCCIYRRRRVTNQKIAQVPPNNIVVVPKRSIDIENIPKLTSELRDEHIGPVRNNPVNVMLDSKLTKETLDSIPMVTNVQYAKPNPKSSIYKYAPRLDEMSNSHQEEVSLERRSQSSVDSPSKMLLQSELESQDNKSKNEEESGICLVCQDRKVNIVFLDCMHICTCEPCSKLIINSNCPCPFCREEIKSAKKVFIA